jgi:death-on-curing protein
VRYLSVAEVVELHRRLLIQFGGSDGIRDRAALQSAVGEPLQTFDGDDLYPTLIDKAAAIGFFLCRNHAFVDGNKRVAHAALEATLLLNGFELSASVDEQERVMLRLANGSMGRDEFTAWVRKRTVPSSPTSSPRNPSP